jgi:hypothetical protein
METTNTTQATSKTSTLKIYKNQRGSTALIEFHGSEIKGLYMTAVARTSTDVGVPRPLTGYAGDGTMAFAVKFDRSLASFSGNITKVGIETLWNVTSAKKD